MTECQTRDAYSSADSVTLAVTATEHVRLMLVTEPVVAWNAQTSLQTSHEPPHNHRGSTVVWYSSSSPPIRYA